MASILADIFSAIESGKRRVKDAFTDEGLQKTTANLTEKLRKLTSTEERDIKEALADFSPGGVVGKITKEGMAGLQATHGFNPYSMQKLFQTAEAAGTIPSIDLLSYAVRKNPVRSIFGSGDLVLNPSKVDPKGQKLVDLFNRDAYTETFKSGEDIIQQYVRGRKAGAFGQGVPDTAQALSIAQSPNFRSFKEFEESPLGAGLLGKTITDKSIDRMLVRLGIDYNDKPADILKQLSETAFKDERAQQLLDFTRRQGSEYAEGKVWRPFALTGDNVLAAIMGKGDQAALPDVVRAFEKQGIPVGDASNFLRLSDLEEVKGKISPILQKAEEVARATQLDETGFGLLPKNTGLNELLQQFNKETFGAGSWTKLDESPGLIFGGREKFLNEMNEKLAQRVFQSPQFNAYNRALENLSSEALARSK